ncbi:MAG TPA: winged helix-turn-helix domain-containing protein [Dehalococcoidia bacterium]|nr:winged helix-turn-helix domain-containing protein [Dehalococcoidia bacterium]
MGSIILITSEEERGEPARQYLAEQGHQVSLALGGAAALRALASLRVDAVVFSGDGTAQGDFYHWLRADPERRNLPALWVLPAHALALLNGTRPGVDRVLRRPLAMTELGQAVNQLLEESMAGEGGPRHRRVGNLTLDQELRQLKGPGGLAYLTPIEFRLFSYFVKRVGRVISVEELLEKVWRFYPGTGSPEVVRTHIRNMRDKIAAIGGSRETIQTLPRRGYRLVTEPES